MTQEYLDNAKNELKKALKDHKHPFRYFTLATMGINQTPRLRTVVLRDVDDELKISIFTDRRSKKVTHIRENNKVCLLFFDHFKLLQVKIDAVAFPEENPKRIKKLWEQINEEAKHDYSAAQSPGTKVTRPDKIEYLNNSNHFCVLNIEPYKIEYLQLKRPIHLRVMYSYEESGQWSGHFMVP
ncbi:pyridoxamine 5'-phosphate oxidase family protein [Robertkochia solimangrovi]|uniref:pyridoxamine 5'-phosphate oxidase family protein n=1 Tax=Robertkochia solimangrovi TaxID=2213046 RepID=UPI0013A58802|nr:pyridoxamine 5'-phosphate oxidase family protein [Robertkochia solimangrovi]